jgi:NNP family nitrate/nitrite transporter-like MFS transporter
MYLALSHFIIHVYTMLLPVLLLPLQDELGVSLVQLSLLASIPRLLNIFVYIPAGIISDKNPSRVLTLSFIFTAIGAYVIPVSRSFTPLLLGFILLALGSTFYHPPSLKMASLYNKEKVSLAMGIHNIGASLGFAVGPLVLGIFLNSWGWRYSFYLWGVFIYTSKNMISDVENLKQFDIRSGLCSLLSKNYLLVVMMSTFVEAIFNILVTFVPVYFTTELGMSYSLTSIITGLGPLTGLVGSFIGGYAGVRFGDYKSGLSVLVTFVGFLFLFPRITSFLAVVVVYCLYRCLQSAYMPLLNSMIVTDSSKENRSLSFSFNSVVVSLIGAITITVTSILIETYGINVIFSLSIGLTLPTILIVYILLGQHKNH